MTDEHGFSLIEVLVALTMLGVLATMVGLSLKQTDERQQYEQTIAVMTAVREAILGKPGLYCNGRRQFTGYVADMGGLPLLVDENGDEVSDLVTQDGKNMVFAQPRGLWTRDMNSDGDTVDGVDIPDGSLWKYYEEQRIWAGWRGPYLTPPADGVLRDGWGNALLFSEGEIITLKNTTPVECEYRLHTTVFGIQYYRWDVTGSASAGTYRCKCDWAFPANVGSTVSNLKPYPGFASPYYRPNDSNYPYGGEKWEDCWETLPAAVAPVIEPKENGINLDYPNSSFRSVFTNLFFGPETLTVVSYGADGKPGGSDYNRDIVMTIYRNEWTGEVAGMAGNTHRSFAESVAISFPKIVTGQSNLVQWRNEIMIPSLPADELGGKSFYFGTAPLREGQLENGSRQSVLIPMGIRSIRAHSQGTNKIYVIPVEPTGNFIGTVGAGE